MSTIHQLTEKAIGVAGLPEDIKSVEIWESTMSLRGRKKGDLLLSVNGDRTVSLDLPKGLWTILGMSDQIGEEEWKKVSERVSGWPDIIYYDYTAKSRDYRDIVEYAFENAIDSGHSLLKEKGIKDRILILIKK